MTEFPDPTRQAGLGGLFRRRFKLEDGEVVVATFGRDARYRALSVFAWVACIATNALFAFNSGTRNGWWPPFYVSHLMVAVSMTELWWAASVPARWVLTDRRLIELNQSLVPGLLRHDGPCYIELGLLGPPRLERKRMFSRRDGHGTLAYDIEGSPKVLKIRHIRDFETAMQLIGEGRSNARRVAANAGADSSAIHDRSPA